MLQTLILMTAAFYIARGKTAVQSEIVSCSKVHLLVFNLLFTVRKRSCAKVMFLHLSVSHSVHRGCLPGACVYPSMHWADTPQADTPLGRHSLGRHLPGQTPLPGGHCSRWYASYWNAFLLIEAITRNQGVLGSNPKRFSCIRNYLSSKSMYRSDLNYENSIFKCEKESIRTFECTSSSISGTGTITHGLGGGSVRPGLVQSFRVTIFHNLHFPSADKLLQKH